MANQGKLKYLKFRSKCRFLSMWYKITSTSEILCVHAIDSLLTWNCYKYKSLFWIWSAFHALIIFFRGEGGYWSFQSVHVHGVPAVSVPSWKIGSWRAVAFLSLSLWLLLDLIGRDLTSQADRRTVSSWTSSSFNSLTNKRKLGGKVPPYRVLFINAPRFCLLP